MSRKLKFRVLNEYPDGEFSFIYFGLKDADILERIVEGAPIDQYTGLKDKNDKEIYEGDITKSCDGYIRQVVWKDNSWKYYWKVKKYYQGESYFETIYNTMGETSSKRFGDEIIGNIHENQELLKEE